MLIEPLKTNFSDLALPTHLLRVVAEIGYTAMTPVQALAIPILLNGLDLIAQSKTGSGKTAAFALPILTKMRPHDAHVQALVLCPTRELCAQVAREIRRLARGVAGLRVLILAGGQPMAAQLASLDHGAHMIVATPGRLLDHLGRGSLNLRRLQTLVLDEADRMLDLGFADDIAAIIAKTSASRQTVFFSATYPASVDVMSQSYQRNPKKISIDADEPDTSSIQQFLLETQGGEKLRSLRYLLQKHRPTAALVFANQKLTIQELTQDLTAAGISVAGLHGDLEQFERDQVLARFRNRSVTVLLATDVAARGLDIDSIDLVINYDLPPKPEVYVHRIGRTGRAGKRGMAISLVTPRDWEHKIVQLEAFLGRSLERHAPVEAQILAALVKQPVQQKSAGMETLYISAGRKDKMRPGDILGALTGEAGGLSGASIGKIEIHDRFSYVGVARDVAYKALRALQDGRIKGRKCQVELVR